MAPQKTDTRERIVQAAFLLFLRNGYRATGLAEIVREAGVNPGSLYYFFPTKEDLVVAVLEWCKANLWPEVVQPVFDRVEDPIERIFGLLDGYRRMLEMTQFTQGCPMGNLTLEIGESHPAARALIAENFTGWTNVVRDCVKAAGGRLPPHADADELATFVLTTMEGAVMLARTYRSFAPYDAAVSRLRDYFERLIEDGTEWGGARAASAQKDEPKRSGKPRPRTRRASVRRSPRKG